VLGDVDKCVSQCAPPARGLSGPKSTETQPNQSRHARWLQQVRGPMDFPVGIPYGGFGDDPKNRKH
jgi:hypothetical protein